MTDNPIEPHSYYNEFRERFDGIFPPLEEEVRRDEIGGLDLIVERLDTFKRAIKHPKMYEIYGVRPPRGFLLSGPPGCGKTYIAKYLSKELKARFVDIPLSKYESKWVGESSKTLTEYIDLCRGYYEVFNTPVLLFFDEGEEAFKDRNLEGWHGPRVNVLLREMDGLSGDNSGLYFGAATNHKAKIDRAATRPGRLDFHIDFPEYTMAALADVFRATMIRLNRKSKFKPFFLSDNEYNILGGRAYIEGFTPAHINELFSRATNMKIKELCDNNKKIVKKSDCAVGFEEILYQMDNYESLDSKVTSDIGFSTR